MTVNDLMKYMDLRLAAGEGGLLNEIEDVYVCDLLSWVMAHAAHKSAWVTIQTHPNIVAVASLMELSCIIIPENADLDDETIAKANNENIPILISKDSGYKICCSLNAALNGE